MNLSSVIARPMLAAYFVADGIDAALRPDSHVEKFRKVQPMLERAGLPPLLTSDAALLARAAGAVSAGAGIALAVGKYPRLAAATLAALNIPITLINYPVWDKSGQSDSKERLRGLLRGLGLGGGLLLAACDRAGRPSLAWKLGNAREQRAQLREQKAALKERFAS